MKDKVLIINGHPDLKKSFANSFILSKLIQNQFNIRNLIELYPDYKINTKIEQETIINSELIILQYPIYWCGMPAILKQWLDCIFIEGFAYGNNTNYLKNKKVFASVTLAGENTKESETNLKNKILFPVFGLAEFCEMKFIEPSILYGMNYQKHSQQELIQIVNNHTNNLINKINTLL